MNVCILESLGNKIEIVKSPKSNLSRSSSANSLDSNNSSNALQHQEKSESTKVENQIKVENLINPPTNSQLNENSEKKTSQPHKEVLKESEFQVKIADLGNACWTVIKKFNSKIFF